jgi:hypothetical protein
MLKRTKGRILLTLLVVTGFAGTLNTSSLSNRERKVVIISLKENKAELIKKLRGLTQYQLDYRLGDKKSSIRETLHHIVAEEAVLWNLIDSAMRQPANPEKRADIVLEDEDILNNSLYAIQCGERNFGAKNVPAQSLQVMLNEFKASRSKQLKYIKTTTEDLRNRVVSSPIGAIDCYQLLLYMAGHSNAHLDEIANAVTTPGTSGGN